MIKLLRFFNLLNKLYIKRLLVNQVRYLVIIFGVLLFTSCNSSNNSNNSVNNSSLAVDSISNTSSTKYFLGQEEKWYEKLFSFKKKELDTIWHDSIIRLDKTWKGDFDGMKKRRVIRALVVYNQTNFYFDNKGQPRGIVYDALTSFEKYINRNRRKYQEKIHVVQIPVRRDQLIPYLINGNADIVAANLTITEERKAKVDFSNPSLSGVKEIVVSGPKAPYITKLEDLSGQLIWVRQSSSYYNSIIALNKKFKQQGLAEINIRLVEEQLETEELLEMVAAGIINITISDDYLAEAWSPIFSDLTIHSDLSISKNGSIGWMFRQNSPLLKSEINAFLAKNKEGSLFFNMKFDQYYNNQKWLKRISQDEQLSSQIKMNELFKTYSEKYDFDWMMIASLAYQESHLDQKTISHVGAIGVMQVMQSTANDHNVNIPNIHDLEGNIHAGTKYLRFILDHYFEDAEMNKLNKHLFAFASYNAGPARINRLRRIAEKQGFDPNIWFQNVEIIAGRNIGRETVQYVGNIFKYYVAYKLAYEQMERDEAVPTSKK